MHQEEKPAYIMAMAACVNAKVAGMQAENQSRAFNNLAPMYVKADFDALIDEYGVHHNAVLTTLRG